MKFVEDQRFVPPEQFKRPGMITQRKNTKKDVRVRQNDRRFRLIQELLKCADAGFRMSLLFPFVQQGAVHRHENCIRSSVVPNFHFWNPLCDLKTFSCGELLNGTHLIPQKLVCRINSNSTFLTGKQRKHYGSCLPRTGLRSQQRRFIMVPPVPNGSLMRIEGVRKTAAINKRK